MTTPSSTRASGRTGGAPTESFPGGLELLHPGARAVPDRRVGLRAADGCVPALLRLVHRGHRLGRLPLDPAQLLLQLRGPLWQVVASATGLAELLLGRRRGRCGVPGDRGGLL